MNCSERGEIGLLHPRSRTATVLSRLGSTLRHRDAGPRPLTRRSAVGAPKTKQTGARHAAHAAVVVANEAVAQAPGGAGGRLRAQPVAAADDIRRRRRGVVGQQHGRAGDEAAGAQPQGEPVRWQRARRPHRRDPLVDHQHVPPARDRPAAIHHAVAGESADGAAE